MSLLLGTLAYLAAAGIFVLWAMNRDAVRRELEWEELDRDIQRRRNLSL